MAFRRGWTATVAAATLIPGLAATALLSAPADATPSAPTRLAASDPLMARGCFAPVLTRDRKGITTFQLLGVKGGPMRASLGRITSGTRVAAAGGWHGNGLPTINTTIGTGVLAIEGKDHLVFRPVRVDGNVRKARATREKTILLSKEAPVRLLAGDWEPEFGGLALMVFGNGVLAGRVTADEAPATDLVDTQMLFEKRYRDLTSVSFASGQGGSRYYGVTNKGALVRLFDSYKGEKRVTLDRTWKGMSKPVPIHECHTRAGETILVAADSRRRFHVFSELNGTLRRLGVTRGLSTGTVL